MDKNLTININTGTFLRAVLICLLIVFLYMIKDIVAVVLFSVVIASGVDPAAKWFQRYRLPRLFSVIIVYLIAFLIMGAVFYLIVPTLFSELSNFSLKIPEYSGHQFGAGIITDIFPALPESATSALQEMVFSVQDYISGFMSGFFSAIAKIFGGVFSLVLIVVLSFYFSVQEGGLENFMRTITPIRHEKYVLDLWARSSRKIGKWLSGQILLAVLVGVLVFLGLSILRVPYALVFALTATIFELIPIFGPVLASIAPIVVAFYQSTTTGLIVVALYILIQQFENHLVYPLVVRKLVGVPPITTILAIIVGAKLYGFFGILLAVPIVTILVEFLNDIEKRKTAVT